jgi:hypothetical protein
VEKCYERSLSCGERFTRARPTLAEAAMKGFQRCRTEIALPSHAC